MKLYRWSWDMQIIEHIEIRLKWESEFMSTGFRASLLTSSVLTQASSLLRGKLIHHLLKKRTVKHLPLGGPSLLQLLLSWHSIWISYKEHLNHAFIANLSQRSRHCFYLSLFRQTDWNVCSQVLLNCQMKNSCNFAGANYERFLLRVFACATC